VRSNGGKDALTEGAEAMQKTLLLLGGIKSPLKDNKDWMNFAKNSVKHMNEPNDDVLCIDKKEEAKDILERAINNFNILALEPTEKILEYYEFSDTSS